MLKWVLPVVGLGVLGAAGWATYVTVQVARGQEVNPGLSPAQISAVRASVARVLPGATPAPAAAILSGGTTILPAGSLSERAPALTGLPGYGRMTFLLPRETRLTEAEAILRFDSEIPLNVNATLRVSVNGARRADVLLADGRETRELRIPLQEQDLALNSVQITFAITGVSTSSVCSVNTGNALVNILPGTMIATNAPSLDSISDRYRASGQRFGLSWPTVAIDDAQAGTALLAAVEGLKSGLNLNLVAEDSIDAPQFLGTLEDLNTLGALLPSDTAVAAKWPLQLIDPAVGGGRSFTGTQVWRYGYAAADLPDGRAPGRIDYSLNLGTLGADLTREDGWMVSVMLNGHLLDSFAASAGKVARSADIPAALTGLSNQLEITLGRAYGDEGICNDGPLLVAELESTSVLQPGTAVIDDIPAQLQRLLGAHPRFDAGGTAALLSFEAQAAMMMLADLPPLASVGDKAEVLVARTLDLPLPENVSAAYLGYEAWVYLRDDRGRVLGRLDDPATQRQLADRAVAILILVPRSGTVL